MKIWRCASKPVSSLLFLFSLFFLSFAQARYDIARNDFTENTYVGPSLLNEARLGEWNWAEDEAGKQEIMKHQKTNLFSTRIDLSSMGLKPYIVPDVNYPVLLERDTDGNVVFSNAKNSMGLNLIPVGAEAPVYRITDENRVKFAEHLRDPNTGRELGRTVDEDTFDRVVQEVSEERRANAPKLTIRDFDDNGDVKGISTLVKEQFDGSEFNVGVYNAVTKGLRDAIAELPAPGEFDEEWVASVYPQIVKDSGLRDVLTQEELASIISSQKTQLKDSYGEDFRERVFDKLSAALSDKITEVQADGFELDITKLTTFMTRYCTDNFRLNVDQQSCANYSYYMRWGIQSRLPRKFAESSLAYAYSDVVGTKRFDENEFWQKVWSHKEIVAEPNPNSVSVSLVDRLVRQSMFPDAGPNDTRHMYAIVGHTDSSEAIYKDLQQLTSVKVQTSIHHVSAYYGANGYTRRGFLEGGQPNNIYTVSLKGVDQKLST
ncbi:MAG: hypothetical protein R3A80_13265 [Bdellovibrionota bacterium]